MYGEGHYKEKVIIKRSIIERFYCILFTHDLMALNKFCSSVSGTSYLDSIRTLKTLLYVRINVSVNIMRPFYESLRVIQSKTDTKDKI